MNKDIAIIWEQSLRDRKLSDGTPIKQGTSRLTTILDDGTEADCCLGVLCKIAILQGLHIEVRTIDWSDNTTGVSGSKSYNDAQSLPDPEVIRWAELRGAAGVYEYDSSGDALFDLDDECENALAPRNDNGYDFDQIADLIHEHWEVL